MLKTEHYGSPGGKGMVMLLAPGLFEHGGIQTYMRQTLTVLSDYAGARGAEVRCISLADASAVAPGGVQVVGCHRRKWRFALSAFRVAFRQRPSLVIVGHVGLGPVALVLSLIRLIRSYVIVLYGVDAWRRLNRLDQWAARRAAAIVAVSRYTALRFGRTNAIDPARIDIIAPCMEVTDRGTRQPAQDSDHSLRVLTVSRLVSGDRDKGVDKLLKAIRRANDSGTAIDLTIVGDGDDLGRLQRLSTQLALDNHVRYTGSISSEELDSLYQSCDVFALPSRMEGFGIVFIEAMGWGKPCVGGNHGGTPEIIEDGVDGCLVEHGDVDGLASTLVRLARDTAGRTAMGACALAKAQSKYSFGHMRRAWGSVFDKVYTA
jgi:phosphatidyl-myo-inositol dimannoside synthase